MKPSIITYIFIILLSASCTGRHTRLLDRAEQLTFTDPDSACALLDSMPAPASGELSARHALLTTGAQYYAARCPETDSIIRIAVDYYDTRTDSPRRMLSYYYQGLVLIKARDYGNAVVSLLNAEHTARILNDHKYLGLIYRAIADSFDALSDNSSALDYYKMSYEEFCQANDTIYKDYALCELGRAYINTFNYKEALIISKRVYDIAEKKGDITLMSHSLRGIAGSYDGLCLYDSSKIAFSELIEYQQPYIVGKDWVNLGISYIRDNDLSTAIAINDSIKKYLPDENFLTYLIKKEQKKYNEAIPLLESELKVQNDAYKDFVLRNFSNILREYYVDTFEKSGRLYEQERHIKILSISLAVIILSTILIFYYKNIKSYRRKIDNAVSQALVVESVLKSKIQQLKVLNNDTSLRLDEALHNIEDKSRIHNIQINKLQNLLNSQLSGIDNLCNTYFQYKGNKLEQKKVYEQVMLMLQGVATDSSSINLLEDVANQLYDNIIEKLKNQVENLTGKEIQLYVLIVLGFSLSAISVLQKISIDSVYNRKAKIKNKIISSKPKDIEELFYRLRQESVNH